MRAIGKMPSTLVGFVMIMGVAAAVALISLPARASGVARRSAHVERRAGGSSISEVLRAHFALLREVRQASIAQLPDGVLEGSGVDMFQVDRSQAQVVHTVSGPVWVVPGAAGACVVTVTAPAAAGPLAGQTIPYASCEVTATIERQGLLALGSQPDGTNVVFGIVPDGNADTSVTLASGQQSTVPVFDNVMRTVVADGPIAVAFNNASGVATSFSYVPRPQAQQQAWP
jgi:hypothetical protein